MGKGNRVLAALTERVAYFMVTVNTKSGSSGNQRNREGQQNRVNGPENQRLGNNNRIGTHKNNGSNSTRNPTPRNWTLGDQVHCFSCLGLGL